MSSDSPFPLSHLYSLKDTPTCGRGIFATVDIPLGTVLMQSDAIPASVIYRPYKREVCAQCFAYEGSRNLKSRMPETGNSYCGEACLREWESAAGEEGVQAWTAVETFVKKYTKISGAETVELADTIDVVPTELEIEKAWEAAEKTATIIRETRKGSRSKAHLKTLRAALLNQAHPDTLCFTLSTILSRPNDKAWASILHLAADTTPYISAPDLVKTTSTYIHLLSILPLSLLPHVTQETIHILNTRDSHNAFGIRSLDDSGAEMFGYGVWPAASYFNHSCAPNVGKRRVGRTWEFWAEKEIVQGEELCISYMGGDERDLDVGERRGRTGEIWGFVCGCARCVEEEEMEGEMSEETSCGESGEMEG